MNRRITVTFTVLVLYLIISLNFLFDFNKRYINADNTENKSDNQCSYQVSGNIEYSHWSYQNQIRLDLYHNNKPIVETKPAGNIFNFSFSATADPTQIYTVKIKEIINGKNLTYDVADIKGLECGENSNVNISI